MVFGAGAFLACAQLVGLEPPPPAHESPDGAVSSRDGSPEVPPSLHDGEASAPDAAPVLDASEVPPDGVAITDAADSEAAGDAAADTCALWSTVSSPPMSEIAAGPKGDVWTIGTSPWMAGSPDFTNYELAGNAWTTQQGGGVQISISPDTGNGWLLNTDGQIFTFISAVWHVEYSDPLMSVIAAGPKQAIWAIGKMASVDSSPDRTIYSLVQGSWVQEPGGAIDITVAPDTGSPWIVDASGLVYLWDKGTWSPTNRGGVAMSRIAAGPGGVLWAIGKTPSAPGSFDGAIYRSIDGVSWQRQPGAAFRIAVSPDGVPWIVTAKGVVLFGTQTAACPVLRGNTAFD